MKNFLISAVLASSCMAVAPGTSRDASGAELVSSEIQWTESAAYGWLETMLEAAARDVEALTPRPPILSRQMAIAVTAMYDAWACYDDKAQGTMFGGDLRRPAKEHTQANKEKAIAYAMYRACLDQFPMHAAYLEAEMKRRGLDPKDVSLDTTTPQGIGNAVAKAIIDARHHDGANQLGDEIGSDGNPYSDYTMYAPVNSPDKIIDPDRWQPIPFDDGKGGKITLGYLAPHWYRVKPYGLEHGAQFRPGPPPKVGSEQLKGEVDQCIEFNANLTPEQKAIVEFMRDGPRSTGQSGHWLRFAQAVSRRDKNDTDRDVKLFFAVGNAVMDAFIASWDAKRAYDSSRPWTLVHYYYAGKSVQGWGGPGKGVVTMKGDDWHPYSPYTFITPPFPGYVSGHSCASGAAAETLKLFTESDTFGIDEKRVAGDFTEPGFTCEQIQMKNGKPHAVHPGQTCDVSLPLPTFTETAEMAGISRVLGGYHIQADNVAGLELGRTVARYVWAKSKAYFDGTAFGRN